MRLHRHVTRGKESRMNPNAFLCIICKNRTGRLNSLGMVRHRGATGLQDCPPEADPLVALANIIDRGMNFACIVEITKNRKRT